MPHIPQDEARLTLSRYQSSQTNVLTAMSSWIGAMATKVPCLCDIREI